MLRLLQSNQPAAWVVVPLTAALLWGISAMGVRGTVPDGEEFLAFAGILASSRILHLTHLESKMRTRPTSIPGWCFVLWALPLLAGSPARLWWSGFFVLAALRHALRLPEDETGRNHALFWMGVHLGLSGVVWLPLTIWSILLPLGCLGLRPFRPAETLSLALGMGASWGFSMAVPWLLQFPLPMSEPWTGLLTEDWRVLLPWIPVGCAGWLFRQRSLARATARQRSARQLTQWMSAAGLGIAALGWAGGIGPQGATLSLFGGGLFCAWTVGWCFPPRRKGTRWVPWLLLMLSLAATVWPWASAQ